jgi:hypothetical protein
VSSCAAFGFVLFILTLIHFQDLDIAKSEFGFFWNKGVLGDDSLLNLLLSGEHQFGPILLKLLAEAGRRKRAQRVVIVLDALDEITRRVIESEDAVDTGKFIDATESLMLHLVKPIVNASFDGISVSTIFSCLKRVQPDQRYAPSLL